MELSKKISRQLKKTLGEDVLQSLEVEPEGEVHICAKKLASFIEKIEKAYEEYNDRLSVSYRNLEISSEELNAKNRELKEVSESMRNILDSLGEGYFVVGRDRTAQGVYSRVCVDIFGEPPVGKRIEELLMIDETQLDEFNIWFDCIMRGSFDAEMANELGPNRFELDDGRHFSLSYRLLESNDEVFITVIARDITQQVEETKKVESQVKRAAMIEKILENRTDFNMYLQFVYDFLEQYGTNKKLGLEAVAQVKMDLHTIKGSAGYFCMDDFVELVHKHELILQSFPVEELSRLRTPIDECIYEVSHYICEFHAGIEGMIGSKDDLGDLIICSRKDLISRIEKNIGRDPSVEEWIVTIVGEPINDHLKRFKDMSINLARQLGKKVKVEVKGPSVCLIVEHYSRLFASFNHIIRNCIDHGIEDPEERLASGKEEAGLLTVTWNKINQNQTSYIEFTFRDDGQGFDIEKLRSKLSARGHSSNLTDQEVIQLTLTGEVSSRDIVTEVSGFGIGISSVYYEVSKLGGEVFVDSCRGEGTELVVRVPEVVETQKILQRAAG